MAEGDIENTLAGLGISPDQAQAFIKPILGKVVKSYLEQIQLPQLLELIKKNEVRMAQIEAVIQGPKPSPASAALQKPGTVVETAPAARPNTPLDPMMMQLIQGLLGQIFPQPNAGGQNANLEGLARVLDVAAKVSEMTAKPYNQGREAAFKEINETVKLARAMGVPPGQLPGFVADLTAQAPDGQPAQPDPSAAALQETPKPKPDWPVRHG